MASISATTSAYSNINDSEFLGYDESARRKWAEIAASQAEAQNLLDQINAWDTQPHGIGNNGKLRLQSQYNALMSQINTMQGEAQLEEIRRENRGATLTQQGVNLQATTAGTDAINNENLLARNINQEIQGRISLNNQQASEALVSADALRNRKLGQKVARAGQAGFDANSGTGRALTDFTSEQYDADKAAIEGYRVGMQNLLLGQGEAATKSAESLAGTVTGITDTWKTKSTESLVDVTGTYLRNAEQYAGMEGFSGNIFETGNGISGSRDAVGSTLSTWSFQSYLDTLDALTSKSTNKSTWEQMLLEKNSKPVNPYAQFNADISPLTPLAGVSSNLLAIAADSPLTGQKNTGRLI